MADIISFIPELILSTAGLGFLLVQAFGGSRVGRFFVSASILVLMGTAVAVLLLPTGPTHYFSGLWVVDVFARYFKIIFLVGSLIAVLLSSRYTEGEESMRNGEYFALILFATAGMMIMAGGVDFIIVFLGLEVLSLCIYPLAGSKRADARSGEAAFKYFILGAFATAVILFGIALLYGATGSTHLPTIARALHGDHASSSYASIGAVFILVGFAFKLALVPFHLWAPDVYDGAPMPVTVFMAAGAKAAAFAAVLRIFLFAFANLEHTWAGAFWVIAVFTMTVGNAAALVQTSVKRMLAYSSIAHAGYIVVGFFALDRTGIPTIAFYLLAYTFMNGGAFAVLILLSGQGEKRTTFEDYRGLAYRRPLIAFLMSVFLFSLAGIPPTAGFAGKFFVFGLAIENGHVALAIIGVLNSVISVYYYLRLTVMMYMREETPITSEMAGQPIPIYEKAAVFIAAAGTLLMGMFPVIPPPG